MTTPQRHPGLVDRWRAYLPLPDDARAITLNEGDTPLIALDNLTAHAGLDLRLYAKFEGLNPTGSFKDRGMTVAVTHAAWEGSRAVICASTGNTSASAAAYAARAGMRAFVLIPEGKIAMGKLAQAMMHGAEVLQIQGNFDDGMALVKQLGARLPITIVNSINPWRLQGQKTAAFEIVQQLGQTPDYHCLPVGNAGNISAYWMGYREAVDHGMSDRCPVMAGFQASGAAPFLRGAPVEHPETVATAIRIGTPQSWDTAIAAKDESGGWFDEFTDQEILATQKLLAEKEGVFCEPASAISVAGALRHAASGRIGAGSIVVCTLTGHGLKDPDAAIAQCQAPTVIPATSEAIERFLQARL